MTIKGATNTEVFQAYVREILVPTLRPWRHRGAGQSRGPLNPIELMWSKVKALLRATAARSETTLLQAIAQAFAAVTANDAKRWFAHYGYSLI